MTLLYRRPATEWVEALPVGNGRMGAMVFGGVARVRAPGPFVVRHGEEAVAFRRQRG